MIFCFLKQRIHCVFANWDSNCARIRKKGRRDECIQPQEPFRSVVPPASCTDPFSHSACLHLSLCVLGSMIYSYRGSQQILTVHILCVLFNYCGRYAGGLGTILRDTTVLTKVENGITGCQFVHVQDLIGNRKQLQNSIISNFSKSIIFELQKLQFSLKVYFYYYFL